MAITKERAANDGQLGGGAPELRNKEKLEWEEVEGEVLTVAQVVKTKNADGDELYAVIFEEHSDFFFWCGIVIQNWINFYGDELLGTRIKVGKKEKSKSGRTVRKFDIV